MAEWFIYQYDIYPNDMDPDSLGIMLVPVYDNSRNLIYSDSGSVMHNNIRRVQSTWGVNPDIKQMDFVIHRLPRTIHMGTPPLYSSSTVLTPQWFPTHEQYQYRNEAGGFQFENITAKQCLIISRDLTTHQNIAKLMQLNTTTNKYSILIGQVIGIRIHKLTLFNPGESSWFSKYVTAHTTSIVNMKSDISGNI